jgi:hypothetical protein
MLVSARMAKFRSSLPLNVFAPRSGRTPCEILEIDKNVESAWPAAAGLDVIGPTPNSNQNPVSTSQNPHTFRPPLGPFSKSMQTGLNSGLMGGTACVDSLSRVASQQRRVAHAAQHWPCYLIGCSRATNAYKNRYARCVPRGGS